MCDFCNCMCQWYTSLPKRMRDAGVYLEFGATLQVHQKHEGTELRFILDKGVPRISYCPECGANVKKRIREWRRDMAGCLQVMTKDGIAIHVLPDSAKCRITGESPMNMDKCPIMNFDDTGAVCCPDICNAYTEDSEVRNCNTCKHDMGGGYNNCKINLESECAAGDYEAWEPKA